MSDTIAVIGATRGTGLQVMHQLINAGRPAAAVVRNPDKGRELIGAQASVVYGDVTRPESLVEAVDPDWAAIVFTVDITGGIGGRGLFASREKIRAVMYGGLVNTVEACRQRGFKGRLVLLSTIGLTQPSTGMSILNRVKPGLRDHSLDKGEYLKKSGLDYCIVRAGILNDKPGGAHVLEITARDWPLEMRYRISRSDLARVLIACATHPATHRRELSVFWGEPGHDDDQQLTAKLAALAV